MPDRVTHLRNPSQSGRTGVWKRGLLFDEEVMFGETIFANSL
jgi:hypothetical protein